MNMQSFEVGLFHRGERQGRLPGRILYLAGLCLALAMGVAAPVSAASQRLNGAVPSAVKLMGLTPTGVVPATNTLRLAIGLQLQNTDALSNLLQQLYDPTSPNYRQFLTPQQFTAQFGPSQSDYDAVIAYAQASGFTVEATYSNRMMLDVSGTVANIEKAFGVTLLTYQHPTENRVFFAPSDEPVLDLSVSVVGIAGLDNYIVPKPMDLHPEGASAGDGALSGSGPQGTYLGYDFRDAYLPGVILTGNGQTVGLLQFDSYYRSDITAYEKLAGLPNVTLENEYLDGFNGTPGANADEVSLDIEMVASMAPGISLIKIYSAGPYGLGDDILNQMANEDLAPQISASWTYATTATTEQIFEEFGRKAKRISNALGDSGAYNTVNPVPPPTDDPYITSVGGTTLTTTGPQGAWKSETVWNWFTEGVGQDAGSGGISPNFTIPSYQVPVSMTNNGGSSKYRDIPDVALTADNVWVIYSGGQSGSFGGTSCASPLWAGFAALMNQQAALLGNPQLGFINPAVYAIGLGHSYTNCFHDITTGNNTNLVSTNFFAKVGYDLCTGWGTPAGRPLMNALAGSLKPTGVLQISVSPGQNALLLAGSTNIFEVTAIDVIPITNATVTASIPGVTNLTFSTNGETSLQEAEGIFSAKFIAPTNLGPITMTVIGTAPGETAATNQVTYTIVPAPPNDYFTNATKVPITGASYQENNFFATLEKGEPAHDGDTNDAGSLWWVYTALSDTNILVDTTGSSSDTVIGVYTGKSVFDLEAVASAGGTCRPTAGIPHL